jgi:hypothetical protein
MNAAQFAALPFAVAKRGSAVHSGCPTARGADDREAIPSSILDEIWATGIIQSQADATARSATLNALLLEELAVADAAFAIAAAPPIGFLGAVADQDRRAEEESTAAICGRQVSMREHRNHGARFRL